MDRPEPNRIWSNSRARASFSASTTITFLWRFRLGLYSSNFGVSRSEWPPNLPIVKMYVMFSTFFLSLIGFFIRVRAPETRPLTDKKSIFNRPRYLPGYELSAAFSATSPTAHHPLLALPLLAAPTFFFSYTQSVPPASSPKVRYRPFIPVFTLHR